MKNFFQANNPVLIAVVLIAIVGGIYLLSSSKAVPDSALSSSLSVASELTAPELAGIHAYINTEEGLTLESLRGKVVLIDFWTYSCINCIRTLPYLTAWDEKYRDNGLVIVGVHSPEFAFEKELENVKKAIALHGIKYPVVLDNDFQTWRAFNNHYWPHKFLIDASGVIRYDHIGEGSYEETEQQIQKLLMERDAQLSLESASVTPVDVTFNKIGTPELYLGHRFARSPLGNEENFHPEEVFTFTFPESFQSNLVYLEGDWLTTGEYSELISDTGKVALQYTAKNVNIVSSSLESSELTVILDGTETLPTLTVQEDQLYVLVAGEDYASRELVFEINGKGFQLYTFTFG